MSRLLSEVEASEFQEVISAYRPNNEVLQQFKDSNFAVIAGPAGAGKDTLRNGLIRRWTDIYMPVLSTTTRPPRPGETDSQDYYFREIEAVAAGLSQRIYFQAALVHNQQVSCLHVDEVRKLSAGQWGLSILIPSTEQELRVLKPDIKTIFIIPPSLEVLRSRINSKRSLDEAEIIRRLQAARKEIVSALEEPGYYCVISDLESEVEDVAHRYLSEDYRDAAQDQAARRIMQQLMLEL